MTSKGRQEETIKAIRTELTQRVDELLDIDKYLEAKRLEQRTSFDLEMIQEIGYCSGIENYSRHLSARKTW